MERRGKAIPGLINETLPCNIIVAKRKIANIIIANESQDRFCLLKKHAEQPRILQYCSVTLIVDISQNVSLNVA